MRFGAASRAVGAVMIDRAADDMAGSSPLASGDIAYLGVTADAVILFRAKRGLFKPRATDERIAQAPREETASATVAEVGGSVLTLGRRVHERGEEAAKVLPMMLQNQVRERAFRIPSSSRAGRRKPSSTRYPRRRRTSPGETIFSASSCSSQPWAG